MQKRLKSILRKSIGKEPEPSKHDHGSNRDRNSKLSRVEDQPTSVDENSRSKPTGLGNTSPRSDRARPISSTHGSPATEPPSNVTNTNGTTQSNQNSNAQSSVPNRREIIHGQNSAVDGERVRTRKGVADDDSAHPKTAVGVEHKASMNPRKTPNQTLPAQSVDPKHRGMDKVSRSPNTDEDSFASAMSSVSSDYGDNSTHKRGLSQFERSREAARSEPGLEKIQPDQTTSKIADHAPESPLGHYQVQGGPTQFQSATSGGHQKTEDRELREHLRLNGVDITDTVDTDRDITLAPAVKHELIKPHQHEIVESKIFREIHNYEHFHYIQPVMTTEVLSPRHWIPNPAGEGLIEISADELPARTGENRWWSVVQHQSPYSAQKTRIKWRTEPEVIEHGMIMTEGGFERRETTIIHPPTLASLEGYSGPVQPVHFDHKTGKRWMGEMSTMDELQDLQRLLDSAPEAHAFQLNELNKSLPTVSSNAIPKRKSVPGETRA